MEDEGYSSPCEGPDEPQIPINEPSRNTGKLWEETIHANGPKDRPLGKHASRHVEFQHGAIGSRIKQRRIEVSYDAFCKSLDHEYAFAPSPGIVATPSLTCIFSSFP
ncbi:unnamed protein product [Zymoseptoria tritici ST99CH_1A5]|uniref:Uncharacterized protein n=1 Tax=Zymoseptoria tritici ST99CH_1A5 TaxID=1276529 RepID=A0A1Y6LA45_ZYMTR|nr:unnamed protein product [Zymoseptoria tritici ST99CH_1A5]